MPAKPFSPNRLQFFGIGLGVGIALGLGLSVLLEFLDDRVYSEKTLKRMMPVDVLVEIPPLPTAYELERDSRQSRMAGMSAGAVFASILIAFAVTFLKG